MSRKKKKSRGDPRKQRDNEYFPLLLGPARTLLKVLEQPNPEELSAFLADWPFSMDTADARGRATSLRQLATEAVQGIVGAAEGIVALEDANLLLWQETENAYWMLVPAGSDG